MVAAEVEPGELQWVLQEVHLGGGGGVGEGEGGRHILGRLGLVEETTWGCSIWQRGMMAVWGAGVFRVRAVGVVEKMRAVWEVEP